jgi:Cap4-like dsDNA endonuclease family protein
MPWEKIAPWGERARLVHGVLAAAASPNAMSKLHQLQPELVGARTGELYEYQYHQVASATLLLLDGGALCIYCEWHDDYVAEDPSLRYSFHQVKTKTKKAGPWKVSEFFGTPRRAKKAKPADKTSFFLKMFRTWLAFKQTHAQSLLVTDNDADQEFQDLVGAVQAAATVALLPVEHRALFGFLVASYPPDGHHLP